MGWWVQEPSYAEPGISYLEQPGGGLPGAGGVQIGAEQPLVDTQIGFAYDVLLTPASLPCCVPAQCPCTQGIPSFPICLLMGTLFPHWETRVILPILQMGKWRLRSLSFLP